MKLHKISLIAVLSILIVSVAVVAMLVAAVYQENPYDEQNFDGLSPFPSWSSLQYVGLYEIEDFEHCETWNALTPSDLGFSQAKKVPGGAWSVRSNREMRSEDFVNTESNQTSFTGRDAFYCLGIKEWTYYRGFTWTEITPPAGQPLDIPGGCKALYIWACGRNYRHHLEAFVRTKNDNYEYRIDMGELNFKGWKRMKAYIPDYIPQYQRHVPQFQRLYITKLVIRHDPDERNGVFYLYLDDLDAAVDVLAAQDWYDGSDMINEAGVEIFEMDTPNDTSVIQSMRTNDLRRYQHYQQMLERARQQQSGN